MHAGGGLFGDALDGFAIARVPARMGLQAALDGGEEHFFFFIAGLFEEGDVALLGAHAQMDEHGGVAAVVEDHVRRAAVSPFEDAVGVVPIVHQALALDGEDRGASGGDGGGGVVLGRIDVAGGPAHIGAQSAQRLDEHACLDGHVERTGDAGALERLRRAIFGARGHEAGHFGFGDIQLLAAPDSKIHIGDGVIMCVGGHGRSIL